MLEFVIELFYGFLVLLGMRDGLEEILEKKIIPVCFIFRAVVNGCKVLLVETRDVILSFEFVKSIELFWVLSNMGNERVTKIVREFLSGWEIFQYLIFDDILKSFRRRSKDVFGKKVKMVVECFKNLRQFCGNGYREKSK